MGSDKKFGEGEGERESVKIIKYLFNHSFAFAVFDAVRLTLQRFDFFKQQLLLYPTTKTAILYIRLSQKTNGFTVSWYRANSSSSARFCCVPADAAIRKKRMALLPSGALRSSDFEADT